jgi:type VI protein secretion system component Hcp
VMQIQSFSLTDHEFSILKAVDSASPQIFQAVVQGTHFSTAELLIYDSAPTGSPDATLVFDNLLASSYQIQGGNSLQEQDTFDFESLVGPNAVPEPTSLALLSLGTLGLAAGARSRRRG